jgi:hypothetical protein
VGEGYESEPNRVTRMCGAFGILDFLFPFFPPFSRLLSSFSGLKREQVKSDVRRWDLVEWGIRQGTRHEQVTLFNRLTLLWIG